MRNTSICAALSLMLLAVPASAQESSTDATLKECRAIGSDSKRLRCYDRTLDELYGVDEELQEKRAEYKRERFGLPVDDSGNRLTELEAAITEVDENLRTGVTFIALENGQVWQLLSSGGLRARFRNGQKVTITESRTGGYRLRLENRKGFKGVKRIR